MTSLSFYCVSPVITNVFVTKEEYNRSDLGDGSLYFNGPSTAGGCAGRSLPKSGRLVRAAVHCRAP